MDDRIETLLAQLTLEEKIAMLAGADSWHTVAVPRLGIPAIKVTDGPNGARGAGGNMGPTSACFPVGVALAATWNMELVERVGNALAEEVQAKGAHILLAPTVNIQRTPLGGRNFECYSEDPHLTARIATAYIRGLQSRGAGACIKHFACNDEEFERRSLSSQVTERPLREIYLRPFQLAIRDARPWCVMSAYNRLNGVWCSENARLLRDILKDEWGFDGIVMSDWYGTYTPHVAAGGLDLEMPGPARWMGHFVRDLLAAGETTEADVDDKVRRLLRTIERAGAFEHPELEAERAIDRPEHRLNAREAAVEAIVLLKNEAGLLPLDATRVKTIAVIGENARKAQILGGGSASVTPHYVVSPLAGITERAGARIRIEHATGCYVHRNPPEIETAWFTTADGAKPGLTVEYFNNQDLAGAPHHSETARTAHLTWWGDNVPGVDPAHFSVRFSGTLTAPESGHYYLHLMSVGPSRLLLDGQPVLDLWHTMPPDESREVATEIDLEAGSAHTLVIEYSSRGTGHWRAVRLGCRPAVPPEDMEAEAVALAARSDVAIVFAGTTNEWESEGADRPDMELPGRQVELLEKVAAANPNTIVVLNTGSPIPMPWLGRVKAVLQAWFAGQEAGHAVAAVLFGDVNPSGKLPQTYPHRLEDTPAFINFPGENGKVLYGEGLFVGYRYYDKRDIAPLFPFGYGLSYTTFEYRDLQLAVAGGEIAVSLTLANTGPRTGQEVVQVYVRDVQSRLVRPPKELKAFAKIALAPGEARAVTFTLGREALEYYDQSRPGWIVEPGTFEVLVGSSSRDIRLRGMVTIEA